MNPLGDNPGSIDASGFDPKADPNEPYILRDPDAVDVPIVADTSQPPPDPGAGISKTVNPLTDTTPPPPPGGTLNGGPGGDSTPASIASDSPGAAQGAPQVAVPAGDDFQAPAPASPVGAPEPGAGMEDLDGDGQPG